MFSQARVLAVMMILVAIVLGVVIFLSSYTVQSIRVSRMDFRTDGASIGDFAHRVYIGQNIFLLRRSQIEDELTSAFPEIASVQIERELPATLRLIISTHPVAFRWACERITKSINKVGEIVEQSQSVAFYVNRDGRITRANPDETEVFLIYEKSPCPAQLDRRVQIMEERVVKEIFAAKAMLEEILEVPIDRAGYFRNAREIHLISTNEVAYWIDFATPVADQIEKLRIARALEPELNEPLDHVDLRVPAKLFYAPKR